MRRENHMREKMTDNYYFFFFGLILVSIKITTTFN
jgi:hypothetical protein